MPGLGRECSCENPEIALGRILVVRKASLALLVEAVVNNGTIFIGFWNTS